MYGIVILCSASAVRYRVAVIRKNSHMILFKQKTQIEIHAPNNNIEIQGGSRRVAQSARIHITQTTSGLLMGTLRACPPYDEVTWTQKLRIIH